MLEENQPRDRSPAPRDACTAEEKIFTEKLDKLHPVQQLLEESSPLVGPNHRLDSLLKQQLHRLGLKRGDEDEEGESEKMGRRIRRGPRREREGDERNERLTQRWLMVPS